MQPGAISVFGTSVMARFVWIKGRLVILDQIIAASPVRQDQQILHRRPESRQSSVGLLDRSGKAMILSWRETKVLAHIVANFFAVEILHQVISHNIDPAVMSKLGEIADQPEEADIASGARQRLWHEPVNYQG